MSFLETVLALRGYAGRNNFTLQQTRMMMYTIACTVTEPEKRGEIYDMFYIPGDPTPAEREAAIKKQLDAWRKEQEDFTNQVRQEMQEQKNGK